VRIRFSTTLLTDIWVCLIMTSIILVPTLLTGDDLANDLAAIPIATFLIGHSAMALIYPYSRKATETLDFVSTRDVRRPPEGIERVVLSCIVSVASSAVILFIMVIYEVEDVEIFPVALSAFYLIAGLMAFSRASLLEEDDRHRYEFELVTPEIISSGVVSRGLSAILFLSILFSIPSIIEMLGEEKEEGYTEFFILDSELSASDYEITIESGEFTSIFIGISNKEGEVRTYSVEVTNRFFGESIEGGERSAEEVYSNTVSVGDGDTEFFEYAYSFDSSGMWRIDFDLFSGQNNPGSDPHRHMHLWVNVQ